MSCQCEIYEICQQCAPSEEAFLKAVKDRDDVICQHGPSSSKSYTLDDLEQLARQYVDTVQVSDDAFTAQLILSIFIEYLRKREREVGDEG